VTPEPAHTATPRQEELVDHALALVREAGLPGLTVRRLAERAGFTEAALYRHFASKQELLVALIDSIAERLLGPVREFAADRELPVKERLRAILRHHVGLIFQTGGLPILVIAEAAAKGDEAMLGRARRMVREYGAIVEGLLAELPASERRPPAQAVTMLMLGLVAASALRLRVLPDPQLEAMVQGELVDFLVDRLLVDEGPAEGGEAH
jgi:TetR/AcrR family transcriptional regulator